MLPKITNYIFLLALSLLLTAPAAAETTVVAGDVSGMWTAAGSPYLIEGDITVPAGQTLVIEPGVQVHFQGLYTLTVNGTLQAVGTESELILFTGIQATAHWHGIYFIDAPDGSQLTHVIVENSSRDGIFIDNASPLISYSTIRANGYGGIYMLSSNARLIGNHIIDNTSEGSGGGVFMRDSNPELTGNIISNNAVIAAPSGFTSSTRGGGGIFARSSDPVLRDNVISNNSVSAVRTRGGGIHFYYSDPILINNTISGNTAGQGAGIYLYYSEPTIVNTILWNDGSEEIYVSEYGSASDAITVAYSDLQGGQAAIITNGNATVNWLDGNIGTDPLFIDPTNGDYQLQAGSPAIDAGTAYLEWEGQVLIDLSPGDYSGSAPDMGAFESGAAGPPNQPPVAVASVDPDHGSAPLTVQFSAADSTDSDGTIVGYAWDFGDSNTSAEANPVHTYINVGLYQANLTVTDDGGATHSDVVTIDVLDGTTILGGDVSGTWTTAGSPYRIEGAITVPVGAILTIEPGVQVLFAGSLTVNGTLQAVGTESELILFTGAYPTAHWGGIDFIDAPDGSQLTHVIVENASGIDINNASPLISYNTIRDNENAGIQMVNSNARLIGNHIIDNTSERPGGGVYMLDSNPELTGNIISNNTVRVTNCGFSCSPPAGGGIFARSSNPVLRDNVISGNSFPQGGGRGGGLNLYQSDPVLINNTITGNTAGEGAGIYLYHSTLTIVNTILWNDGSEEIYDDDGSSYNPITVAFSDVQGGQSAVVTTGNATVNWLAGNVNADPLFADPANGDYELQAGSPAIDGATAYFEWDGQVLVDLGPGDYIGSAPDMGAFESIHAGTANLPPVAQASADPTSGIVPLAVQFSSTGSIDPDGTIVAYTWEFNDGNTSSQTNPIHTYMDAGVYQATLTVTDDDGATGSATVMVTVTAAQNEIHVQAQTVTRQRLWWFARGIDTVLVTDQNNQPLAGVSVTATYSGPNQGQVSGTTGSDGKAVLRTGIVSNPQGMWCFEITTLSKDGYVYDFEANVITIQCETN
ncbi:Cytochrome c551/c552 [Olavius sp. associated proteobacterium Delta 1]|nr:Cytochrome c551/c552 [Olavius sp. associated proteobacterium Delta 1]